MISKLDLVMEICRKAGITRKNNKRRELTKEELYKLNAYIGTKCKYR